ncbi:MAG: segregation/condensation protein A [Nitrospinota bacterium]|nr:segregation/condensation protein A [Nitrospinota bacterium]
MTYNIKLDVFEGPLDLLLHLIKEHQVDIYDIPIALVTEQYLQYIELMKSLNLDVAGEFLVMASTLTYIKSRMLLPKHEQEEEEAEEGEDPRDELVARLVEYKKIKEAAVALKTMEMEQSRVFVRQPQPDLGLKEGDLLLEVNVLELLKAFKKILDNYKGPQLISVTLQEISVTDKINEIMAVLESVEHCRFDSLFKSGRNRGEVVATFLALLELMRLKLVRVNQGRIGGDILVFRAPENGHGPDSPEEGEEGEEESGAEESGMAPQDERPRKPHTDGLDDEESGDEEEPDDEEMDEEEMEDDNQDGYTPES